MTTDIIMTPEKKMIARVTMVIIAVVFVAVLCLSAYIYVELANHPQP